MATRGQIGGMSLTDFERNYLRRHGFLLERNLGSHQWLYRHTATGVMFGIGPDEGTTFMSATRVDTALKDLDSILWRIEKIQRERERERTGSTTTERAEGETSTMVATQTGTERRQCRKCGVYKRASTEDFPPNPRMIGKLDGTCRVCKRQQYNNWRKMGRYLTDAELAAEQALTVKQPQAAGIVAAALAEASPVPEPLPEPLPEPVQADSVQEGPAADVAPVVPVAPVTPVTSIPSLPLPFPLPAPAVRREEVTLQDFVGVTDSETPAAFVDVSLNYVVIRVNGALYVLTLDGGPGEPLTERTAAYILRHVSGAGSAATIRGVMFY